ncbi:MAG: hypothetical protein ACRD1N_01405 [Terriglobia bacterium]
MGHFLDFYRCPESFGSIAPPASVGPDSGYFRFGPDLICFGRCASGQSSRIPENGLYDAMRGTTAGFPTVSLPFDPGEVVDNLRLERYLAASNGSALGRLIRDSYYLLRPALGVPVRKHLQKLFFRGWEKLPFPSWPVDTTVDRLFERLMLLALEASGTRAVPFIWFWPDGAPSCAIMTHDVETAAGAAFCANLMDIDDAHGISASFQLVPEERYPVSKQLRDNIRRRGFELNVQDLNHDGRLFRDQKTFLARAGAINRYAREYGSRGFRSAAMYRNPEWYGALEVSYDLSVPNTARLEPQRGGCCTVFPYFIGNILELPLTATQDYSLFHILNDYSIALWNRQVELIREKHGLVSFIIHPDYIIPEQARGTYLALLDYLVRLRDAGQLWFAQPGEVDTWWRQRAAMQLISENGRWVVKGPGSERARIAFAAREDNRLVYRLSNPADCPA